MRVFLEAAAILDDIHARDSVLERHIGVRRRAGLPAALYSGMEPQ